jgi:hypothetical protein
MYDLRISILFMSSNRNIINRTVVPVAQCTRAGRDRRQGPLRGSALLENALPALSQTRLES